MLPGWDGEDRPAVNPYEGAAAGSPGAGPAFEAPPRRPATGYVLVAAVGLLIAGLAGIFTVGSRNGPGAIRTTTGQPALSASVERALASRTAKIGLHLDVGPGLVEGSGTGFADFGAGSMWADMSMKLSRSSQNVPVKLIFLSGVIYEQIPGIDRVAPGKSWLSLDLSAISQVGSEAGALGGGTNPAAMLRLLTAQGAQVRDIGQKIVDGVVTEEYQVVLSPAVIERKLATANIPSWMRSAMASVTIGGMTQDVYIDRSDQLRRTEVVTTETVGTRTVTSTEATDYYDYGVPVRISAPSAAQVLPMAQFLQQAQSASTRAS